MKTCSKCGVEKELAEFHKNRCRYDGVNVYCKECTNEHTRKWYVENRKRRLAVAKKWEEDNPGNSLERGRRWRRNNREKVAESGKKSRAQYPERAKAHDTVNNAVKAGRLPHISTQTCDNCGEQAHDYHHDDYSKPLEVKPKCRECHRKLDPSL